MVKPQTLMIMATIGSRRGMNGIETGCSPVDAMLLVHEKVKRWCLEQQMPSTDNSKSALAKCLYEIAV